MNTLTETLRRCIQESDVSYYRMSLDSGVNKLVISRFARGETSIILSGADKLAQYFHLELRPVRPGRRKADIDVPPS